MRLLICAGGTGGGVYPALAVLKALTNDVQAVLWVGGESGMEADLIQRESIPFATIPAAGVHGVGLRALPGNFLRLVRGTFASRRILNQFKPDVLLFTGGYLAAPMAVATGKVPTLLYVPDIEPGLALKFLARFSDTIAITAEESRHYFSKKAHTVVTGYPTRPEISQWTREKGRDRLGLTSDLPVLLITGGSKGARTLNQPVFSRLADLLAIAQIVHITGTADWGAAQTAADDCPHALADRYHPFPYLHDMGAALAAADLAVSRAGASTLGEYPLFGLPAVLVPYQYAWRYQKVNAEYLVKRGAAEMLQAEQLESSLFPTVKRLLGRPEKLQAMRQAMFALAQPRAAENLAVLVRQLANQHHLEKDGQR